jgi:hypothetical protein
VETGLRKRQASALFPGLTSGPWDWSLSLRTEQGPGLLSTRIRPRISRKLPAGLDATLRAGFGNLRLDAGPLIPGWRGWDADLDLGRSFSLGRLRLSAGLDAWRSGRPDSRGGLSVSCPFGSPRRPWKRP